MDVTNRRPPPKKQDTIKTRMQLNAQRYPTMGATGKTIVAEEGVRTHVRARWCGDGLG